MTENRVLSVGDIAKETGLSRQRIWQLAVTGGIPADRANPGGKHHRFRDSAPFVAWRKEKAQQSARPRARQVRRRAYRRRQEKIEKLREILENQTEVSASDKKAALLYYGCLLELTDAMSHLYMLGWWVRPWKMKMTQQRFSSNGGAADPCQSVHSFFNMRGFAAVRTCVMVMLGLFFARVPIRLHAADENFLGAEPPDPLGIERRRIAG